jgi:hypothetical protein
MRRSRRLKGRKFEGFERTLLGFGMGMTMVRHCSGGLISKSLCGISYKKFFIIPPRPLFVIFCMVDYKSLAAIAALLQWPVSPWE